MSKEIKKYNASKMNAVTIRAFVCENPELHTESIAKELNISVSRVQTAKRWIKKAEGQAKADAKRPKKAKNVYTKPELNTDPIENYVIGNYGQVSNNNMAKKCRIPVQTMRGIIGNLKIKGLIKGEAKVDNSYSNDNGKFKKIARKKIANYTINSGVEGLILTLCYITCIIEKLILKACSGFKFIGVESDPDTYLDMVEAIKKMKLPIKPYFGDVSRKIYGKSTDTYAHLILDYCGILESVADEIEYAITKKVVKVNGYIFVTVSKRGSAKENNIVSTLANTVYNNTKDGRGESERGIEAYFNNVRGKDFSLEELFIYQDINDKTGKNKNPMMLVILKRLR